MDTATLQMSLAFSFGVIFVVTLLFFAVVIKNPTPFQYTIFKTVLSLAAAGVAAMIPGFILVELSPNSQNIIRAGGAMAVFVISYFFNPAKLVLQPPPEVGRWVSREGGHRILEVTKEVIPYDYLRSLWISFDIKVIKNSLSDTQYGFAFDMEKLKPLLKPENDEMFSLGVKVYTELCKRINDETDKDYQAFNKLAQIYLSARMYLRQQAG